MNGSLVEWSLEFKPIGRDGYLFYHEGSHELPLYWEYGGGSVVLIVRFDEPDKLALRYPWAVERRREILGRVAQEIVRQRAPDCRAEIDEKAFCIHIKEDVAS